MRIAILGSGGVGGYFGGRLAASGTDVRFIARGAHLEALRERGLRIESPNGNLHLPQVNATDDPSSIGPVDIVFFTVKLYDTEAALRLLPPLLGPQTLVIPFQNGVDSVDVLSRAVGPRARRGRNDLPGRGRLRARRDSAHRHEPVDLRFAGRETARRFWWSSPTRVGGRASTPC